MYFIPYIDYCTWQTETVNRCTDSLRYVVHGFDTVSGSG